LIQPKKVTARVLSTIRCQQRPFGTKSTNKEETKQRAYCIL